MKILEIRGLCKTNYNTHKKNFYRDICAEEWIFIRQKHNLIIKKRIQIQTLIVIVIIIFISLFLID